jgi:hypothetical protein
MKRLNIFIIIFLGVTVLFHQACTKSDSASLGALSSYDGASSPKTDTSDGYDHGNGGDDTRFTDSAWYSNPNKIIQYCVDRSDDFPASKELILNTVSESINEWVTFIPKNQNSGIILLQKNFNLQSDCAKADLKMIFGKPSPRANPSKVGFVYRESYDMQDNWSHGYLWLNSTVAKWNEPTRLKLAVMHLIGKVMGYSNIAGTIMDDRWETLVAGASITDLQVKYVKIENERQLMTSTDVFSDQVVITESLAPLLGIKASTENIPIVIDTLNMKINIQSQSLRYVALYRQDIKRGPLFKVYHMALNPLFTRFGLIGTLYSSDDVSTTMIIQLLDVPSRPQIVVELNGDRPIKINPLQ